VRCEPLIVLNHHRVGTGWRRAPLRELDDANLLSRGRSRTCRALRRQRNGCSKNDRASRDSMDIP
jgi:hypothetical protein